MSPVTGFPPNARPKRLPPPDPAKNAPDDADDWDIVDVFSKLFADEASEPDHMAPHEMPDQGRYKKTSQRYERDPQPAPQIVYQDSANELMQEREMVCAVFRDDSGIYVFFNHHYRKMFIGVAVLVLMAVSGRLSEATEVIYKLIF